MPLAALAVILFAVMVGVALWEESAKGWTTIETPAGPLECYGVGDDIDDYDIGKDCVKADG